MATAKISAKRIGYLRSAPPSTAGGAKGTGPMLAMWRKLEAEGLIEKAAEGSFRRSAKGDTALAEFDRNLSEDTYQVLNAVRAGVSGASVMKGMMHAVHAGLVRYVDRKPHYVLTEAGKKLADPIDEEGYFTKSANLVRVLSSCTEKEYQGNLLVERLDGESKGKQMLIPRHAFVDRKTWDERHS